MSAPFPVAAVPVRAARVELIPERKEFVPPWYVPHKNPGTIVVQNGRPVGDGFTVAEMLPERRWAVKEDGELLPQLEFRELYWRKLGEWFLYASPEAEMGQGRQPPSTFVANREPVPNVRDYVAMRIDPRDPRKLLAMGYDPDATKGRKPTRLWDSENERFIEGAERMALLVEHYRREQAGETRRLTPHEREEVEAHLAGRGAAGAVPANATQAKLETLTEMLRDGDITQEQYAQRVAAIFGGAEKRETPVASKRGSRVMPCGQEVTNARQRAHVDQCPVCTESDLS